MANVALHRGDDTDSFNGGLFKIDYTNPTFTIKKLEILFGNVIKTYVNPSFPLQVNLRSSESLINSTGTYAINLVISDNNYKKLNIATGSTVTFAEPSTPIVIPYESPILFDLSEVLPANTNPDTNGSDDTQGDNTDTQTGSDDTQGDNTDTQTGSDDTQGDNTDTQTGSDEPQGDNNEPQSGDENNQNPDNTDQP